MDVSKLIEEQDELLLALEEAQQIRNRAVLRAWAEDLVARCVQLPQQIRPKDTISTEHPCSVEITPEAEG